MYVFRKIWRPLFSWNTRLKIRPFALLLTNWEALYFYGCRYDMKSKLLLMASLENESWIVTSFFVSAIVIRNYFLVCKINSSYVTKLVISQTLIIYQEVSLMKMLTLHHFWTLRFWGGCRSSQELIEL